MAPKMVYSCEHPNPILTRQVRVISKIRYDTVVELK